MPEKQIEKAMMALRLEVDGSIVDSITEIIKQALHNSPLLTYLRDKKKEIENRRISASEEDETLYDFICELLNKFDK